MRRDTKIVAATLVAISGAILVASIACTAAIANGASMRWRLLFRLFCHGIPERCLYLWRTPMPICARCTAIYVGLSLSAALFRFLPRMKEQIARYVLYGAVLPMAIDGLTQLAHLRLSSNPLRMETGLLAGLAFGVWALSAIENHEIVTIP